MACESSFANSTDLDACKMVTCAGAVVVDGYASENEVETMRVMTLAA